MDPITAMMMGGNLLNSLIGGIGKQNEAEWNQAFLINLFNQAEAAKQYGQDMSQRNADPARQWALDLFGGGLGNAMVNMPGGMWDYSNYLGGTPDRPGGYMQDIFRDAGGLYTTPEMDAINQGLLGLGGQQTGAGSRGALADQVFAGGGWTPQYQQLFDSMGPMMAGRANNNQLALGDVGSNLIGQRGQTAYTQGFQDRAMDALNAGGQNPWLTNALNQASGTLNNQGQTAGTQALTGAGMGILQSGGETPFTQAGQMLGLDYAGREALMTPEALMNMARDSASDAIRSQAKKAYRDAANRGSGAGAVTTSGIENQMRADFGDQAAALEAASVRDALMQRQALGLQQNQMGAGLLGQQGNLAQGRFGIGANLAGQGQQIAAGREGQAYSAIPGTQNSATNVMQTLGQLGLGALGAENQRMGLGTDMSQVLLNSMLGGTNAWNTAMGNQNQYALGAGQLGLNSAQLGGGLMNNAFGNMLGQGQLGVQRANNMAGQINNAFQNQIGLYGQFGNAWNSAMNPLVSLSGQGLNYGGNIMGGMLGLRPNAQGTSWTNVLPQQLPNPFSGLGGRGGGANGYNGGQYGG